jgi:hypothetical protein
MDTLFADQLWEGILELIDLIFAETHRFPEMENAFRSGSYLRMDIISVATQYAETEEGLSTPDNLLPFIIVEERLKQMEVRLNICFEKKWMEAKKYYLIKQKLVDLKGQINYKIAQFEFKNTGFPTQFFQS